MLVGINSPLVISFHNGPWSIKNTKLFTFTFFWSIWRAQKSRILDNEELDVWDTFLKTSAYILEIGLPKEKVSSCHFQMKDVWEKYPLRFFDGRSTDKVCGSGALIALKPREVFHFY